MKNRKLLLVAIAIIVLGVGFKYFIFTKNKIEQPTVVVTTALEASLTDILSPEETKDWKKVGGTHFSIKIPPDWYADSWGYYTNIDPSNTSRERPEDPLAFRVGVGEVKDFEKYFETISSNHETELVSFRGMEGYRWINDPFWEDYNLFVFDNKGLSYSIGFGVVLSRKPTSDEKRVLDTILSTFSLEDGCFNEVGQEHAC